MMKPVACLGAVLISILPVQAQEPDTGAGQDLYMKHCATCHGVDGQGNGPMAPAMSLQPTDLTRLQARGDGVFPTQRVVKRIDGRDPLVSHGSPMPVFGDFFEGRGVMLKTATGQPIMTSQPVADLVAWLESLQQ